MMELLVSCYNYVCVVFYANYNIVLQYIYHDYFMFFLQETTLNMLVTP